METAELLISPAITPLPPRVRYEEYRAFDVDDTFFYELINGELVKKSAPSPRHQILQSKLFLALGTFVATTNAGIVLCAPVNVFVDEYNVPQPDLLFVAEAHRHFITDDGIFGPPDLVVEILSPHSIARDRVAKMRLYQRLEVPEYWICDPNNQSVEIYERTPDGYELLSFAVEQGLLQSKVLPDLALDAATLFH
jgi:Uma2 family endonuclease